VSTFRHTLQTARLSRLAVFFNHRSLHMDWDATPWADVVAALREADWSATRPRGLAETLNGLGPPPIDASELAGRLKCNAWCYRATYGLLLAGPPLALPCLPFLRLGVPAWGWRSAAAGGALLVALAVALANDAYAASASGRVLRVARRVAPGLASRMRAAQGSTAAATGGLGAPPRGAGGGSGGSGVRVAGVRRPLAAAVLVCAGLLLLLLGGGVPSIRRAALSSLAGFALAAAHSACRSPDLKARLSSTREDFRAVWRASAGGVVGGGGGSDLRGRMSAGGGMGGGMSFTGAPLEPVAPPGRGANDYTQ